MSASCWELWVVRSPAGTRLDSSNLVKKQVCRTVHYIVYCTLQNTVHYCTAPARAQGPGPGGGPSTVPSRVLV